MAFYHSLIQQLIFRHSVPFCRLFLLVWQVLYPASIIIMVSRTIFLRIFSDSLVEFRYFPSGYNHRNSWLSNIWKRFKEEGSLLSFANRGRWQTVETRNEARLREGNRFRLGIEPLFVDFTKWGTVFVVVSLLEVSARYFLVI